MAKRKSSIDPEVNKMRLVDVSKRDIIDNINNDIIPKNPTRTFIVGEKVAEK